MSTDRDALIGTTTAAACLVGAPAIALVELMISPLTAGSTSSDLQAINANQGAFVASVLVGLVATVLYVPAFVGLASAALDASPRLARLGAAASVVSMMGFFGVRMVQAVELQLARDHLPLSTSAGLVDHLSANPIGIAILVAFLGGSIVGLVSLACALWRANFPKIAVVLFGIFPVLDLMMPGRIGSIVSHGVLLTSAAILAAHLVRRSTTVARADLSPAAAS